MKYLYGVGLVLSVLLCFISIWVFAICFNELPDGYQTASVFSGVLGVLVGIFGSATCISLLADSNG